MSVRPKTLLLQHRRNLGFLRNWNVFGEESLKTTNFYDSLFKNICCTRTVHWQKFVQLFADQWTSPKKSLWHQIFQWAISIVTNFAALQPYCVDDLIATSELSRINSYHFKKKIITRKIWLKIFLQGTKFSHDQKLQWPISLIVLLCRFHSHNSTKHPSFSFFAYLKKSWHLVLQ